MANAQRGTAKKRALARTTTRARAHSKARTESKVRSAISAPITTPSGAAAGSAVLRGRTAIVTGGGRGIGLAIARAFAAQGARVAICGRDEAVLNEALPLINVAANAAAKDGEALALPYDMRDRDGVRDLVREVVARWERVDILVNNAGISGRTPILGGDDVEIEERWHDILAVNLDGVFTLTRAAMRHMTGPSGRIINISSVLGRFGVPGYAAYCTAKHGIIGFTRAVALELASRGITVNAICPGWVSTEMAWKGMRDTAASLGITFEAFRAQAMAGVPIGRMIEPEEVAQLAVYIASDAASGMTGQAVNLCGGQTMD
jgi:ketoreductase